MRAARPALCEHLQCRLATFAGDDERKAVPTMSPYLGGMAEHRVPPEVLAKRPPAIPKQQEDVRNDQPNLSHFAESYCGLCYHRCLWQCGPRRRIYCPPRKAISGDPHP